MGSSVIFLNTSVELKGNAFFLWVVLSHLPIST
jgi:hypothetical protein